MGEPAFLSEEFSSAVDPDLELVTTSGYGKNGALSVLQVCFGGDQSLCLQAVFEMVSNIIRKFTHSKFVWGSYYHLLI